MPRHNIHHRSERLASLIHEEAARFIEKHALLPTNAFLTVTHVEMDKERFRAGVYVSVFPTGHISPVLKELRMLEPRFQDYLKHAMRARRVPTVSFIFDDAELKREQLEKVLEKDDNISKGE